MSRRCPVCDQFLLDDDAVCWQCGQPVAGAKATATSTAPARSDRREEQQERQISPRAVYGTLTVLIVAAALYLTGFLGRQPRVQTTLTDLPDGWTWIRGAESDYTFFLPEEWEVLMAVNRSQEDELDAVVQAVPGLDGAFYPLSRLDTQLRTIVYAHGPIPVEPSETGSVLVARSRALNQLTPRELVALAATAAQELDVTLHAAGEVETFERSYIYFDAARDSAGNRQRCQQHLFQGTEEMLWISACGPAGSRYQRDLTAIAGSFQRLR
ncbi:MAG: hypothetical protein RRC07_12220 [Anaerolineae bacterium]|nr:hypothetical protein [Anaerolineae bacterium]